MKLYQFGKVDLMEFHIDDQKPIYKQIVEQVLIQIKSGELAPGARLPTERELAQSLGVARGTVKKAYRELADNNMIEVIQGSGSYVYNDKKIFDGERRRLAISMIDTLLEKLEFWDFSEKETATLLRICMARRARADAPLRIAIIDCNPESLGIFKRQLAYIPGISLSVFLVDSIIMDDAPERLLSDFDLVLTTETHFEQVQNAMQGSSLPLMAAPVSLSRQTIVAISTLPEGCPIGILCMSFKFANLIREQLELFCTVPHPVSVHFESDAGGTARFLKRFDTVIVPPDSPLLDPSTADAATEEFLARGGKLLPFEYLIDRGTLIYVEDQVASMLRGR